MVSTISYYSLLMGVLLLAPLVAIGDTDPKAMLNLTTQAPTNEVTPIDPETARAISKQVGAFLSEKGFLAITHIEHLDAPRVTRISPEGAPQNGGENISKAARYYRVIAVVRPHGSKTESLLNLSVVQMGNAYMVTEK